MTTPAELAARLRSVLDDMDEFAFDQLREAVADGATSRPASDKALSRARRSVEKAAVVLEALDDESH